MTKDTISFNSSINLNQADEVIKNALKILNGFSAEQELCQRKRSRPNMEAFITLEKIMGSITVNNTKLVDFEFSALPSIKPYSKSRFDYISFKPPKNAQHYEEYINDVYSAFKHGYKQMASSKK
jgi:hypothetical protein